MVDRRAADTSENAETIMIVGLVYDDAGCYSQSSADDKEKDGFDRAQDDRGGIERN